MTLQHAYLIAGDNYGSKVRKVILSAVDIKGTDRRLERADERQLEAAHGISFELDPSMPFVGYWMAIDDQKTQVSAPLDKKLFTTSADTPQRIAGKVTFDQTGSGGPKVDVELRRAAGQGVPMRRMEMRRLLLWTIAALLAPAAWADDPATSPASEETVREYLEVTGSAVLGAQVFASLKPALQRLAPSAPAAFWDEFAKEVDWNELVGRTVPVYRRLFSEEEMRAIIDFYRSPAGQKLVASQATIAQESLVIGQAWGREIRRTRSREGESAGVGAGHGPPSTTSVGWL